MRIVYFLGHPEGIGGASNVMIKQANMMRLSGHHVCVVIQNDPNGFHDLSFDELLDGCGLEKYECIYTIATCIEEICIQESIDSRRKVQDIIENWHADIVHSLQINTSVEFACRRLGIPHVMSIYPIAKGMFDISWTNVFPRYIICDSEYYAHQWREGLHNTVKCIRVSYKKGVNDSPGQPELNDEYDYRFVSIGLLTPYKNQLQIIRFVEDSKMKGVNIHLDILGDHTTVYGGECREYVKAHRLEENIEFRGYVRDVERYLSCADALIHISTKESYPGVIVEALANNIPVIVFPAGGISEIIKDNYNGIYIDIPDSGHITKAFEHFVKMRETGKICELITNGYETYKKCHSNEIISKELEATYNEFVDNYKLIQNSAISDNLSSEILDFLSETKVESEFTKNHLWYIWHVTKVIRSNGYRNSYIWGAGHFGKYALEWSRLLGLNVRGFWDENKTGEYMGYPIFKPNDHKIGKEDIVLVAVSDFESCQKILRKLESIGMHRNKRCFFLVNNPCY